MPKINFGGIFSSRVALTLVDCAKINQMTQRTPRRHGLWIVVALVLLTGSCCQGFVVWQGVQHSWQRHVLDLFATPHRLGSVANYVETVAGSGGSNETVANITMTPGVNGDFAHPSTFFVSFPATPAQGIYYAETSVKWSFLGNASYDPEQKAVFSSDAYSVPVSLSFPSSSLATPEVFLRGWRLDMRCDPSLQPSGRECNSDGVWPSRVSASAHSCTTSSGPSSLSVSCTLDLALDRYWTPILGGGKPFNYVMSFDFYAYLAAATAKSFSSTRASLALRADTHSRPRPLPASLAGRPGFPDGVLAVTGFSFQYLETDGMHELGRYIEDLMFYVSNATYANATGTVSYDYTVGIHAPISTMPSLVDYTLATSLLQFSSPLPSPSPSSASGSLCIPDPATHFSCTFHALPARTNVVVPLN